MYCITCFHCTKLEKDGQYFPIDRNRHMGCGYSDCSKEGNPGHDGSLTTIHSNSAMDCISRLETLVLTMAEMPLMAVRRQIVSAVDIIIHLGRLRDHSRRVLEIAEVAAVDGEEVVLNPLFQWEEERGLEATGHRLINRGKLERWGIREDEISI